MPKQADQLRRRATAVIIENGKILLMRRVKPGEEYFILPGGGVDKGETIEEAVRREVKEEFCLDVKKCRFLFALENLAVPQFVTIHPGNRNDYYFLIEEYSGVPEIGGPEKEKMTEQNQYHVAWCSLDDFTKWPNIFPREGVEKLAALLSEGI
jgi:ADP-ribose pyrophosphatase YjhB (NUDIX family)